MTMCFLRSGIPPPSPHTPHDTAPQTDGDRTEPWAWLGCQGLSRLCREVSRVVSR